MPKDRDSNAPTEDSLDDKETEAELEEGSSDEAEAEGDARDADASSENGAKRGEGDEGDDARDESGGDEDDDDERGGDGDDDESEDDEDDDEDDEDDDDEDDEDDEEPPPARRRRASGPSRGTPRRRARPQVQPPSERQLDTPKVQTLGMLGTIVAATLIMYGAAKLSCNAHPTETRKPRDVPTQQLAKDPKNAAIEVQQRWATMDYAAAAELATGQAAKQLDQEARECAKNEAQCSSRREELAEQVRTKAELLSREASAAVARVTSVGPGDKKSTYVLNMKQEGNVWKVAERKAGSAAPAPAPQPPRPAPAPGEAGSPGEE